MGMTQKKRLRVLFQKRLQGRVGVDIAGDGIPGASVGGGYFPCKLNAGTRQVRKPAGQVAAVMLQQALHGWPILLQIITAEAFVAAEDLEKDLVMIPPEGDEVRESRQLFQDLHLVKIITA